MPYHRTSNAVHFLFISTFLGPIGGIETLIARMSKWLVKRGHVVTLLSDPLPKGGQLFPKEMRIVEAPDQLSEFFLCHKTGKLWSDLCGGRPDVIKAFDLKASWIASVLASRLSPAPKLLFGNYFPYITAPRRNRLKYDTWSLLLLNLKHNFGDDSILCMSTEQITELRRYYGSIRNPILWPLPVESPVAYDLPRTPRLGQVVSIGRLAPMKEYNIYMIDVIARLRQKGLPVIWTVFGEGGLADPMNAKIRALGMGDAIQLKGNLPYTEFASALKNAYVFVGMGTSVIEAALCGVPGVVALAHDTTGVTYGPLYQLPFGNCGEHTDETPSTTVEAEIERVLGLSKQGYEQEVEKTQQYARRYDMDVSMERFLDIVATARPPRVSSKLFYWYYVHRWAVVLWQKCANLRASN